MANILVGNATLNQSESNWDLPSRILPYLLDRAIWTHQQKWCKKEGHWTEWLQRKLKSLPILFHSLTQFSKVVPIHLISLTLHIPHHTRWTCSLKLPPNMCLFILNQIFLPRIHLISLTLHNPHHTRTQYDNQRISWACGSCPN